MAALDVLTALLRTELRDEGSPFSAEIQGDAATSEWQLPYQFIETTGISVYLDNPTEALDDGADYSLDARNGVITLTAAPAANRSLHVEGTYYRRFLTEDLQMLITGPVTLQHLHNRTDMNGLPMTIDTMPVVEQYPLMLLALIEALWILATDAAQNIDVHVPDQVVVPRTQRFAQILQLISARQGEYAQLASLLNVGLYRIEMFTLRRVSRTTNRLVPIYLPMEFDDNGGAVRPNAAQVGATILIYGFNLKTTTAVTFHNNVAASFVVISDNMLQVTVPAGATSGPIAVSTAGGSVTSTSSFTVGEPLPTLLAGGAALRVRPPIDSLVN